MPRIKNLAQRMLLVNDRNAVLVGHLATTILCVPSARTLGRTFLGTENASYGGVHVQGDFAEELFGPDLVAGHGFNIGQFLAVAGRKKLENTSEWGVVREIVPFEKGPYRRVGPQDYQVARDYIT